MNESFQPVQPFPMHTLSRMLSWSETHSTFIMLFAGIFCLSHFKLYWVVLSIILSPFVSNTTLTISYSRVSLIGDTTPSKMLFNHYPIQETLTCRISRYNTTLYGFASNIQIGIQTKTSQCIKRIRFSFFLSIST